MITAEGLTPLAVAERLATLGYTLPEVPAPLAAYSPATTSGDLIYTAGQLPLIGGQLSVRGKVGARVSPNDARQLAAVCAVNAIAAALSVIGPDARITKIVKIVGFVASAPDFTGQPTVVDGASELIAQVFGKDVGAHARSAVGVCVLPLDAPVEVEITAQFERSS